MIMRRISYFSIFEIYPLTFLVRASISACTSSGSASCNALRTVSRNDFANSMRCSLIESLRICSLMSGAAMAFTAKSRASSSSTTSKSLFVLPASSRNCNCNALSCLIVACANSNAAMKSSSEISFELPSTIMMASSVPATIISISDSNNWLIVGLQINSPFTRPTITSEYGPPNGISEITSAAEAPTAANVSASISGSDE